MGAGLTHWLTRGELLLAVVEAAAAVITIVEAIRRDPKDRVHRVLLFEFLALVTFFLGVLSVKFSGFYWPAIIIWMALFLGFTFVAAYFAVLNWLRPTKRAN